MYYLNQYPNTHLTLEANRVDFIIKWWANDWFFVQQHLKIHTSTLMLMGKGAVLDISKKQMINTKSLADDKLVGITDVMPKIYS